MDGIIKESDVNAICYKLVDAAEEKVKLEPADAEEILNLISNLISMNVDKRREEVEASIYECLGEATIMDNLGDENLDETFVHYLTSTYAKTYEDHINYDLGAKKIAPIEESTPPGDVSISLNPRIKSDLSKLHQWDFNVFEVVKHTSYGLVVVTETVLKELRLVHDLDLNEKKLRRFLMAIQESYQDLPYHNYIHAADVTQTAFSMCSDGNFIDTVGMNSLSSLAMIIGATIHDVDHPGYTGKYIVANSLPLAIQYNDQSPLENMHLATAFTIWSKPASDFTEKLPRSLYKDLRKMIIDMVLATDNDMHFTLMGKLNDLLVSGEIASSPSQSVSMPRTVSIGSFASNNSPIMVGRQSRQPSIVSSNLGTGLSTTPESNPLVLNLPAHTPPGSLALSSHLSVRKLERQESTRGSSRLSVNLAAGIMTMARRMTLKSSLESPDGTPRGRARVTSLANTAETTTQYIPMKPPQLLLLQVALHAADISGPAKPWDIHSRWTELVMEEFYKQGDKERELGVPITFAFDRHNAVPLPKFQLGFIKAIVQPLYKSLARVSGVNFTAALENLDSNIKQWDAMSTS